jgi:K+ transporter
MVISTALVAVVARYRWNWKRWTVIAIFGALGLIDVAFMGSNALRSCKAAGCLWWWRGATFV